MKLLLALVLLGSWTHAGDDDAPKKSGFFKAMLKGAAISTVGDVVPGVSGERVEGAIHTGQALRKGAQDITEKEEYFIGRAVSAQILSKFQALDDEDLNLYVQSVAQSVALASDRPEISQGYHVQVLETAEINAMAAPGGFLFVTTGLLKRLKSEDELAAVLAHELAHVAKKHGLKTIKASRLTKAFSILGSQAVREFSPADVSQLADVFGGAVNDVVGDLVVNGYSRDKEFEADASGAQYVQRANYDPKALHHFIETLGQSGKSGGLLKTHPSHKQRLKELEGQDLEPSESYREASARQERFDAALTSLR